MQLNRILPFLVSLFSLAATAQTEQGMQFIQANSWEEVKAKAKAENKYIFLDGYTTWCGPCKMMAVRIFPLPEVGTFYNANFINVKVQLDTTSNDSEQVKKWYADGHFLMTEYKINAFPTYIFFSPDGEPVHRAVGASDAEGFISKGKDALNPDKQYYRLVAEFRAGNRNPAQMQKLVNAALAAYDQKNMPEFTQAYYASQPDLLTPENMKILTEVTKSSKDTGFTLMQQYTEKFDSASGNPGDAETAITNIILREEVFPKITEGGRKMVTKEPNWLELEKSIAAKYPKYANSTVLIGQIMYYRAVQNFPGFSGAVSTLLQKAPQRLSPEVLNSYAWEIFEKCTDLNCIQQAIKWSQKSLEANNDPMFIDTYANLLHKSGNTKEAISWQKKAIQILKDRGEDPLGYEDTLSKMEKGEKTWE